MTPSNAAVEALAEAWAAKDGKADQFEACKRWAHTDAKYGTYTGYLTDADDLVDWLRFYGFDLAPIQNPKPRVRRTSVGANSNDRS